MTTIAKARRIAWISSTVTAPPPRPATPVREGLDHDLERRAPGGLHEDDVARPQDRAQDARRPRRSAVHGWIRRGSRPAATAPAAMPAAAGPTTTSSATTRAAAAPTARWPSSWTGPSSRISPSTATGRPGRRGEHLERSDHRGRRRVVGVVEDRDPRAVDDRAAVRRGTVPRGRQARRDRARRRRPRRGRPRRRPGRSGRCAGRAPRSRRGSAPGAGRGRRGRTSSRARRARPPPPR